MADKVTLTFGAENGKQDSITFLVYGNEDDMSDMVAEKAIEYWHEGSWKEKGIELPTETELRAMIIKNAMLYDDDPADVEYYLVNLDTMFVDYNTMLEDQWFRVTEWLGY